MLGNIWADENVRMTMSLQVGTEEEKAWRCSVEAKQLAPQTEENERQRLVTRVERATTHRSKTAAWDRVQSRRQVSRRRRPLSYQSWVPEEHSVESTTNWRESRGFASSRQEERTGAGHRGWSSGKAARAKAVRLRYQVLYTDLPRSTQRQDQLLRYKFQVIICKGKGATREYLESQLCQEKQEKPVPIWRINSVGGMLRYKEPTA